MAKEDNQVSEVALTQEIESSMQEYITYVAEDRAIPSIIDGMKPVHRRLLHAATATQDGGLGLNLKPTSKTQKSAKLIGVVLGNYHPHGDQACYGALVGMTSRYGIRTPLFADYQGNWGDPFSGDKFAAMRYTEITINELGYRMMADRAHFDYVPNYDSSIEEPYVLCPPIPTVLLNDNIGIAVGMATGCPSHTITSVCDATLAILKNPNCRDSTLLEAIVAPDFVAGGVLMPDEEGYENSEGLRNLYLYGKGTLYFRPKWELADSDLPEWRHKIVIKSLCPGMDLNKFGMGFEFQDLIDSGDCKVLNLTSSSLDVDIHIYYNNMALAANVILPRMVGFSQTYTFNMLDYEADPETGRVRDKLPINAGLRYIITRWLAYRRTVVGRRIAARIEELLWDLAKLDVQHFLATHEKERELFIKSKAKASAIDLMLGWKFSQEQAEYAMRMAVSTIMGFSLEQLEKDIEKVKADLDQNYAWASDLDSVITDEVKSIRKQFAEEMRVKVFEPAVYPEVVHVPYLVTANADMATGAYEAWPNQGKGMGGLLSATFSSEMVTLVLYGGKAHTVEPYTAGSYEADYVAGVVAERDQLLVALDEEGGLYVRNMPEGGFPKKLQVVKGSVACAIGVSRGEDIVLRLSDGSWQYVSWDNLIKLAKDRVAVSYSSYWSDASYGVGLVKLSATGVVLDAKGNEYDIDFGYMDAVHRGTAHAVDTNNIVTLNSGRATLMSLGDVYKNIGNISNVLPIYGEFKS